MPPCIIHFIVFVEFDCDHHAHQRRDRRDAVDNRAGAAPPPAVMETFTARPPLLDSGSPCSPGPWVGAAAWVGGSDSPGHLSQMITLGLWCMLHELAYREARAGRAS